MVSIAKCEKILNRYETKYTKDQIEAISTILYQMANIEYQNYKNHLDGKESHNIR